MPRLLATRQIRQLLKRLSQPGKVLRDPTLVFFILRARVAQQSDPGSQVYVVCARSRYALYSCCSAFSTVTLTLWCVDLTCVFADFNASSYAASLARRLMHKLNCLHKF